MARTVYYVVLHDGQWKITLNGTRYGPYETQRAAIQVAVETARKEGKKNPDGAEVRVQGENNQFRTEWTYENDPYPPPG